MDKKRSGTKLFIKSAVWTLAAIALIAIGYFGAGYIADLI